MSGAAPPRPRRLVLASASPARRRLLEAAGLTPEVIVSGVSEDVEDPLTLARAKADAVAARCDDALVIGCDSMLRLRGALVGKPGTPDAARQRWRELRGTSGELCTGHAVVDTVTGAIAERLVRTVVHFADVSDAEIDAYVASGEPLGVAGAFTIDGLGALFVTRVEGDHTNVIGLSLPTLRDLVHELGLDLTEFWPADLRGVDGAARPDSASGAARR